MYHEVFGLREIHVYSFSHFPILFFSIPSKKLATNEEGTYSARVQALKPLTLQGVQRNCLHLVSSIFLRQI